MTEKQPEALRLAVWLEHRNMGNITPSDLLASAELRRLHTEHEALSFIANGLLRQTEALKAELEALRKDAERYRFAHGNENFAVCIWDDSDCQWFAASDEQLDKAIAQVVQA